MPTSGFKDLLWSPIARLSGSISGNRPEPGKQMISYFVENQHSEVMKTTIVYFLIMAGFVSKSNPAGFDW